MKQLARDTLSLTVGPTVAPALARAGRRGLLPEVVWRHLPVRVPVDLDIDGTPVNLLLPDHDGVARELLWTGRRAGEWFTIDAVVAGAEHGNVIDVGANAGLMSAVAAAAGATVFAFEPVPGSFEWTRDNLERSGLADRCRLSPLAVADQVGTTPFHVPYGDAPSSASLGAAGYRNLPGQVIEVGVTTLDTLLDEGLFDEAPISLIKIDVEGHEPAVLAGAERLIARDRPELILEVNHDGPWQAVDTWLHEHDYRAERLDGTGTPVVSVRTAPGEVHRNLRCVSLHQLGVRPLH